VTLSALAFVPSPPLLLAALGGGPEELRSACAQAISVLDGADEVVIVGAAPDDGWVTVTVDATPWGARGEPAADPLPLALAVGRTLLDRGRLYGVHGGGLPALPDGTGLLVVGDGTAKRTEKAPGHLDPRAEAFDRQVESALAAGDPAALLALDADLAGELLVGGLAAWCAAARAATGSWKGHVHYAGAPYGVGYVVASWTLVNAGSPDGAS
jgi:hypothetical protein